MYIKELNKENLEFLGVGSEGSVYKRGNKAFKVFHDKEVFKNKYEKLVLIKSLNFKFLVEPTNFISINNNPVGYEMELIDNGVDLKTVFKSATIDKKIELLKELERNIKKLHKNNINLVDCNLFNFILKNDKIKHIDIDNYKVGDLNPNVVPDFYYPYYSGKVTGKINENFDKFQMTLNAIEYLSKTEFFSELLMMYDPNYDYLNHYLELADMNKELREFLQQQTSDSLEKEYISDYLHLFKK